MQLVSKFISSLCSTFIKTSSKQHIIDKNNQQSIQSISELHPLQIIPTNIQVQESNKPTPLRLKRIQLIKKLKADINHMHCIWIQRHASRKIINFLHTMIFAKGKLQRGNTFELLCEHIYRKQGYVIRTNGANRNRTCGDGGYDICARRGSMTKIIECKNWNKRIGVKVVREFVGALGKMRKSYQGELISMSHFSRPGQQELKKIKRNLKSRRIMLRDTKWIMEQIMMYGTP